MNTLTLEYSSQRNLERKINAIMVQWGYTVIPKGAKWTPMAEFRAEIGCPPSTLHKILSDIECPEFPGKYARRRHRIVVTPALKQFVKKQADRSKQSS